MTIPPPDAWEADALLEQLAAAQPARTAATAALLARLQPQAGPILEIGTGSGAARAAVLASAPEARMLTLEPSRTRRSLALARLAEHPEWHRRVTLRPEDFFTASLPARIGGAVLLDAVGRFDSGERAAVFAELADRLPSRGAALVDLRRPERPRRVKPYEFAVARIGELDYRGIAEAWPVDTELVRWRTTLLCLDGERVLTEDTVERHHRHPAPGVLAAEAEAAGLRAVPLADGAHWILERD